MRKLFTIYLPIGVATVFFLYLIVNPKLTQKATTYIIEMGPLSGVVFVLLLVVAVVLAPITILPLIPIASEAFGPFTTGILSVVGWTIGSVIAFCLARYLGRPFLEQYLDFTKIDALLDQLPPRLHFISIVLLRHTLPVDLLSYALGLVKGVSFYTFFFATLVGVTYFSFAFAYAGEALLRGDLYRFLVIALVSVAFILIGWYVVKRIQ